jgi:hypothetical protein
MDARKIVVASKPTEWRIMMSPFSTKETSKLFKFGAFILRDFFQDRANEDPSPSVNFLPHSFIIAPIYILTPTTARTYIKRKMHA